jgi:intein/homing endonuclease
MKQYRLSKQQKLELIKDYLTGNYSCCFLSKKYKIVPSSVRKILIRNNIPIFNDLSKLKRKYTLNEHYFDTIDTEAKAYFLGLMYADGCNVKDNNDIVLALQERDKYILETFQKELGSNRPLRFIERNLQNPKWQNVYRLCITSLTLSNQLTKLGCMPNKTFLLKFPTEESIPSHLLRHFIRGYFDGDGCFSTFIKYYKHIKDDGYSELKQYKVSFASTENFCQGVAKIMKKDNDFYYGIRKVTNGKIYTLDIFGKKTIEILDWLYLDATIYLERKYNKYILEKSLLEIKNVR